jgi:hypothetical protein
MHLLRVQFTVRRMMVAVAVVGVATGMALTVQRRAEYCRRMAAVYRDMVGCGTHFGISALDDQTDRDQAMQRRYEHAMWRPWESVP